jgi:predicted AAA+ superfamily ATPase
MRRMLPLTVAELGKAPNVDDLLGFGMMPLVRTSRGAAAKVDLLEAYVETYLAQEIRAEALVRSLEAFTRFLEIAALTNGQVTNTAALARDAAIARPTVQGYFEVLSDTLIGHWLPAWRPRAKVKEVRHPKFCLFDPGVARALTRRLREPLEAAERRVLLETLLFHELRSQIAYSDCGGELSYYRTPTGTEIDFVWTRAGHSVGIEVKATERWRPEFNRALVDLRTSGVIAAAWGVYLGDRSLAAGPVRVLPLQEFLAQLASGKVLVGRKAPRGRRG